MRLETNIPPVTIANQIVPFAKWVTNIGDGREPTTAIGTDDDSNWIQIPKELSIPTHTQGIQEMINTLYSDLHINYLEPSYIRDRAILTPMNEDVHSINKLILDRLPGEPHVYYSYDSICKSTVNYEAQESMYPPEFLNSLKFNGIPNHELELKVGAPIILLRNLNPSKGLCNGTRLIITQLCKRIIEAKIVTGSNIGDKAFIPRINMCPTDSTLPFVFNRLHFPVALCYVMTINKSQGQTLKHVGLYLPKPVFSHGQFYVAISRVTSPLGLKILCEHSTHPLNGFTKNVVYQEVFNNL